ncbi:hypothetical protein thalar_00232 [Litoreibacter arenae DSM 19593]|uniref:Uncharacterized protein n=1 Tax=Litoreibacter arenae DSM 19593 TaxID=1123360 RepID=S9QJR2_9RHOB|nr:hypothetical protein thalar_00232 [Litoreibacter arenae DSM 19593]
MRQIDSSDILQIGAQTATPDPENGLEPMSKGKNAVTRAQPFDRDISTIGGDQSPVAKP